MSIEYLFAKTIGKVASSGINIFLKFFLLLFLLPFYIMYGIIWLCFVLPTKGIIALGKEIKK